jgi:hypothetical protein
MYEIIDRFRFRHLEVKLTINPTMIQDVFEYYDRQLSDESHTESLSN